MILGLITAIAIAPLVYYLQEKKVIPEFNIVALDLTLAIIIAALSSPHDNALRFIVFWLLLTIIYVIVEIWSTLIFEEYIRDHLDHLPL